MKVLQFVIIRKKLSDVEFTYHNSKYAEFLHFIGTTACSKNTTYRHEYMLLLCGSNARIL